MFVSRILSIYLLKLLKFVFSCFTSVSSRVCFDSSQVSPSSLIVFRLLADVLNLPDDNRKSTALTCTSVTPSGGAGRELRHVPPYVVEEYILFHVPKVDAHRFLIMSTREVFTMCASFEKGKKAFVGLFKRCKHQAGKRMLLPKLMHQYMYILFVRSYDKFVYDGLFPADYAITE